MLPRRDFLTKEACGCRWEAKWSQSRVLPSAQLAYETGLSAGSIAMLPHGHPGTRPRKWSPHPELHPPSLGCYGGRGPALDVRLKLRRTALIWVGESFAFLIAFLRPKMAVSESATGSTLEVFLETLSLFDGVESDVHLQFPGQEF
jgi:hypothetical protein